MDKYSYLSDKVLTVGGRIVSPEGLTSLDPRSLTVAIKNKIIKKHKTKKEDGDES